MKKHKHLLNIAFISSSVLFITWGINKIIFTASTLKDRLFSDKKQIYPWRFGNIFYTKTGEGKPLLLIHDLNAAANSNEWESVTASLAKNHTVYSLDLIGCGRSDKPKMTYTNYVYVQLINDFIKDIIKEPADIITSGASGAIAVMGCISEAGLYRRIVMLNPPSYKDLRKFPKSNHRALKYLIECPVIGTSVYNMIFSKYALSKDLEHQFFDTKHIPDKLIDTLYESSHIGGAAARFFYASDRSHFTNMNILNALERLEQSIYIIFGDKEPFVSETLDTYITYNPAIEGEIIPNCGHYPHIECPQEFINLCKIYLSPQDLD